MPRGGYKEFKKTRSFRVSSAALPSSPECNRGSLLALRMFGLRRTHDPPIFSGNQRQGGKGLFNGILHGLTGLQAFWIRQHGVLPSFTIRPLGISYPGSIIAKVQPRSQRALASQKLQSDRAPVVHKSLFATRLEPPTIDDCKSDQLGMFGLRRRGYAHPFLNPANRPSDPKPAAGRDPVMNDFMPLACSAIFPETRSH
jgi:hypothetical protein